MIAYAKKQDCQFLLNSDKHISPSELSYAVSRNRIIVARDKDKIIAWLRYNLFWDNTPFCNMLFVDEAERNKGIGKSLVIYWEKEMAEKGYDITLTSTQINEDGQYFWRKMGYADCGSFTLPRETTELILQKSIQSNSK